MPGFLEVRRCILLLPGLVLRLALLCRGLCKLAERNKNIEKTDFHNMIHTSYLNEYKVFLELDIIIFGLRREITAVASCEPEPVQPAKLFACCVFCFQSVSVRKSLCSLFFFCFFLFFLYFCQLTVFFHFFTPYFWFIFFGNHHR